MVIVVNNARRAGYERLSKGYFEKSHAAHGGKYIHMEHSEQQIEVSKHEAEWVIVLERDPKARNAILVDKKNFKYKKLPLMTMDEWGSYLKNEITNRSGFSQ